MTLNDILTKLSANSTNINFLFMDASRLDKSKVLEDIKRDYIAEDKSSWEKREESIKSILEQRLEYDGVKNFKRRALGLCGRSTIKTPDQMAQLLYDVGIVSSIDEAREIVPLLKGKEAFYMRTSKFMQEFASTFPHLYFDELRDYSGNVSYKITLRLWSND